MNREGECARACTVFLEQPLYCRTFTVQTLGSQLYCCLDVISCSLVGRCQCFEGT